MLSAEMVNVNVYQNIVAIHTKVVDQNVFLIRNVHVIRPVSETNALILVLEHVVKMLNVML